MASLSTSSHDSKLASQQDAVLPAAAVSSSPQMLPPLMYVPTYTVQPSLPEDLRSAALLKEYSLPPMEQVPSSALQPGVLSLPALEHAHSSALQPGAPSLPALEQVPSSAHQPGAPAELPPFSLPSLAPVYSTQFRHESDMMDRSACAVFESATPAAMAAYQSLPAGSPMEEAYKLVMPDYEERKWETVRLAGQDSNVGDVISTSPDGKMRVVTHSKIKKGVYFDTIATGTNREITTYNKKYTKTMSHSGDVIVSIDGHQRLDHTITVKSSGAIIVSPWKSNGPLVVSALEPTEGISEIQIMDSDGENRQRHIIPMTYAGCGDNTARIAVKLTYNSETRVLSATFCDDYIMGFADNTALLLSEVERVYPA